MCSRSGASSDICVAADRRLERQAALAARLGESGVAALLVSHAPNVRYLTGFSGSAGLLLLRADRSTLLTDFRYQAQAVAEAGSVADVVVDAVSLWERLKRLLIDQPVETLGFEAHIMTARDAERLAGLGCTRPVPVTDLVERLRAIKSPEEVASIQAAVNLAQDALRETLPAIRPGQTEFEIAAQLEGALRRRGSEWHPFPTIVASGPRSALPHARSSSRTVEPGDLLVIDFGAQVDGYCADITRTFVVGAKADERQRTVHGIVQEAQLRARTGVRAGMTGREADALARDLIAARGFGEAFGHSLGHGLGLEVHEAPRLAATAESVLPAGAVVTIEPGLYFSGWGGVRIEDDVLLGPEGPICLSDGLTELVELA